jgi:hypothetical protein
MALVQIVFWQSFGICAVKRGHLYFSYKTVLLPAEEFQLNFTRGISSDCESLLTGTDSQALIVCNNNILMILGMDMSYTALGRCIEFGYNESGKSQE